MKDSKQGSALADELIASMREGVEILAGRQAPSRFCPAPAKVDVRAIRTGLGLSQTAVASRFGFSPGTVRVGARQAVTRGRGAHSAAGDCQQTGSRGRGAGGDDAAGGMNKLRSCLVAACLALAGTVWQAHAAETCLKPEPLPVMVDGVMATFRGNSTNFSTQWARAHPRYVALDRPVTMPSLQPGEHCGAIVRSARPDGMWNFPNGARVRVEMLPPEGDDNVYKSRVVCALNGSECVASPPAQ